MKITILGSGGAMPTPRPYCQCAICKKARKYGEPFKRNSSSIFIDEIKTVIDCGEDIGDSLNRRNIKQVDNLFITHWHPDHTFGLRHVLESNYNFRTGKADRTINVYVPRNVFKTLKQKFPVIEYYCNIQKTGVLHLIEDGDKIKIGNINIMAVGYKGENSDVYAYLLEDKKKKVLYTPCDTISFDNYNKFKDLDLLINECGLFSKTSSEISFDALMQRLREIKPKKTIITHIEEIEVNIWGEKHLQKIKRQYSDINFDFAYDGMVISI